MTKRVVAITGGAGALGSALATELAKRGDAVALFDTPRSSHRAETLARELGGFAFTSPFASIDDFKAAVEATKATLGAYPSAAALIAGGWAGGRDEAAWSAMMKANADTAFHAISALLPSMLANKNGSIVVIGSRAVERPWTSATAAAYSASKAAAVALAETVAAEVREHGVRVNAVLPSIMDTPANRTAMPDEDPATWVSLPSAAGVIAFLLSDEARDISGTSIPLYGRA